MTTFSNDPSLWPLISFFRVLSYFQVASLTVVAYDWALTFGQEFELVWSQGWSLMTIIYLSVRYTGMMYTVVLIFPYLTSVSLTDAGCVIMYFIADWTSFIVNVMFGVIVIVRLYAMYQRSTKMLIFLVVTFMAIQITCGVIAVMQSRSLAGEEFVISGNHLCGFSLQGDGASLTKITWVLGTAWETLALFLAVWVTLIHLRELRRAATGWAVGDCYTILVKTHIFYFVSFVAVSCLQLGYFSPMISNSIFLGTEIYNGVTNIAVVVQVYVLGPRLILGLRGYHAKLVADSDEGIAMTSIAFQERVHIITGRGV